MINELENVLKKLIGHKLTLSFITNVDGTLRETTGVLRKLSPEIMELKIYTTTGESELYYLNRHVCTLHSVIDLGK